MNLRDRYICWHKDLIKTGLPQQVSINILNDTLQFCDDFMEQCDKLEKKVNDLVREKRGLRSRIKELESENEDLGYQLQKAWEQYYLTRRNR